MTKLYAEAESVETIANRILPNYHAELATARIQYIFVDEASNKGGKLVMGKVRKVSGSLEFLLEKDFLIEIAANVWNELDEDRRTALVDHLLERCTGIEDEKNGEMKWTVREPDVHEFTSILRRHGAWTVDLEGLVSAAQTVAVDERVQEVVAEAATETQEQGDTSTPTAE